MDLKGKVVVLSLWQGKGYDTQKIKTYLRDINSFHLNNKKDVEVVSINCDPRSILESFTGYLRPWGIMYPVLWDNIYYASSPGFSRPRNPFEIYLIDKKGNIRGYEKNNKNMDNISKECKKLIAE